MLMELWKVPLREYLNSSRNGSGLHGISIKTLQEKQQMFVVLLTNGRPKRMAGNATPLYWNDYKMKMR